MFTPKQNVNGNQITRPENQLAIGSEMQEPVGPSEPTPVPVKMKRSARPAAKEKPSSQLPYQPRTRPKPYFQPYHEAQAREEKRKRSSAAPVAKQRQGSDDHAANPHTNSGGHNASIKEVLHNDDVRTSRLPQAEKAKLQVQANLEAVKRAALAAAHQQVALGYVSADLSTRDDVYDEGLNISILPQDEKPQAQAPVEDQPSSLTTGAEDIDAEGETNDEPMYTSSIPQDDEA